MEAVIDQDGTRPVGGAGVVALPGAGKQGWRKARARQRRRSANGADGAVQPVLHSAVHHQLWSLRAHPAQDRA